MRTRVILFVIVGLVIALAGGGVGGYFLGQNAKKQAVEQAMESARIAVLKEVDEKNKVGNPQSNASIKTEVSNTCNADELQLSVIPSRDSGAGSLAYDILFKNSGGRVCALGGYPGVSLVNANGNQVGEPAERASGYKEELLTLVPGRSVKAVLRVAQSSNYGAGICKDGATKLRVYPPNDTGYVSATAPVAMWCPGFIISPAVDD